MAVKQNIKIVRQNTKITNGIYKLFISCDDKSYRFAVFKIFKNNTSWVAEHVLSGQTVIENE